MGGLSSDDQGKESCASILWSLTYILELEANKLARRDLQTDPALNDISIFQIQETLLTQSLLWPRWYIHDRR